MRSWLSPTCRVFWSSLLRWNKFHGSRLKDLTELGRGFLCFSLYADCPPASLKKQLDRHCFDTWRQNIQSLPIDVLNVSLFWIAVSLNCGGITPLDRNWVCFSWTTCISGLLTFHSCHAFGWIDILIHWMFYDRHCLWSHLTSDWNGSAGRWLPYWPVARPWQNTLDRCPLKLNVVSCMPFLRGSCKIFPIHLTLLLIDFGVDLECG